eukprot:m.69191 g.69191  ORF g.69191 m.69191 type:complete len:51 (+) comp24060_c0_seq4:436-588(+)
MPPELLWVYLAACGINKKSELQTSKPCLETYATKLTTNLEAMMAHEHNAR